MIRLDSFGVRLAAASLFAALGLGAAVAIERWTASGSVVVPAQESVDRAPLFSLRFSLPEESLDPFGDRLADYAKTAGLAFRRGWVPGMPRSQPWSLWRDDLLLFGRARWPFAGPTLTIDLDVYAGERGAPSDAAALQVLDAIAAIARATAGVRAIEGPWRRD